MAVGKVGSFATVEPALVDFGAMAERNIDKIKAEEQAKAAAKAAKEKADRETLKDVKDIDAFKLSGFSGWDDSIGTYVTRLYGLGIDNKELYRQTGDRKYLDNYDRINNEVNTINNESTAISSELKRLADLYSAGKINKTVYEEKIKEFQSLNDGKAKYAYRDGRTVIGFPDEEGNIANESTAFGFVTNLSNDIPEPFDINANINTIVEKVKASEIEKGGALYSKTTTDINSPESEPQRRRLEAAANLFSNQNSSMTEWYLLKRNEEKSKGNIIPLKTNNWTEAERKEAKEFFYNQLIDSYQKKVSIEAKEPSGASGGGDKEDIITGNVVPLGQEVEGDVKAVASKLKGRPVYSTKNKSGIPIAGVVVSHIYSTGGSDPQIYFQTTDPTTTSFGGSGGKTPGYQWVTPQSSNYDAYVNDAIKILGVANKSELSKKLRGESQSINTSQYNN